MKNPLLIIILFIITTVFAESQAQQKADTLRPRYGILGAATLNYHFADFRALPGIPNCCPKFENGIGFGTYATGLIEYPLSNRLLVGLRAGYNNKSAELKSTEHTTVMVALGEAEGIFEHSIKAKIASLVFEPTISYRLEFSNDMAFLNNFYAFFGFQANYHIEKKFEQIERIIKPENTGVFIDTRTRERNYQSGEIPNTNAFSTGVKGGFFYELPLNSSKTLLLVPMIDFTYGISNFVSDIDWKMSAVSAGVSIKYTPFETIYLHKERYILDTIEIKSNTYKEPLISIGKASIVDIKENVKDTVFFLRQVTRTDTLFLPKPKIEKIIEIIDTTRQYSKDYDIDTYVLGKYLDKTSEASFRDTIFVTKTRLRTDTLMMAMPRSFVFATRTDTIKKLTPDFDDTTYVKGADFEIVSEKVLRDTLFIYRTTTRIDTIMIPDLSNIKLKSEINVFALMPRKDTVLIQNITLKMQYTTEVYPLLPYIFFDYNSDLIPERYNQLKQSTDFFIDDIEPNPLFIHHNSMNIIAENKKNFPNAKIFISGYADPYTESNNCDLARKRGENIKKYLVSRGVDEKSIIIRYNENNCYPMKPTRSDNELAYAENRRVVIESDNDQLLKPVYGRRYLNPTNILPDTLVFDPTGSSHKIIKRWALSVTQAGESIFYRQGEGKPQKVLFGFSKKDLMRIKPNLPINVEYKCFDEKGEVSLAIRTLRVIRETDNYELERLSLTLFPINLNTLTQEMREQTSEFLKGLGAQSTISIKAYCDILGDEKTNKFLAETRGEEIFRFIRRTAPAARIIEIKAYAEKEFPPGIDAYNLPEERFLSRTVAIEIRKRRE